MISWWKVLAMVLVATIAVAAAELIVRILIALLVIDLVFGGHHGSEYINDLRRRLRI